MIEKRILSFFLSYGGGDLISGQMGKDFKKEDRNSKMVKEKFRKNQMLAFLSQVEDPELKQWLSSFMLGDTDQKGAPSVEFAATIYFGEREFDGQFYPQSI
jgi:hypothetical protein